MTTAMPDLDKLDLKILYEYDKNIRAPYSAIAKSVNISKQAVKKRIDRLIEQKIISKFITIINMNHFGVIPNQVFVSFEASTYQQRQEFIDYLLKNHDIPQIALCEGLYDLFFGIAITKQTDISDTLSAIHNQFPDLIKTKKIVQFVDTRLFSRDFLIDKQRDIVPSNRGFHSKKQAITPIKEIDKTILTLLASDPRISFVDLAKQCGTSIQTAINRVRFLEKKDIIKGYSLLLHQDVFIQYTILIELISMPKNVENQLFQYFSSQQNVAFVVKLVGEYNFSITAEFKEFTDYRKFSSEFKKTFSAHIKSFIPLLITDFIKLNFLPPEI